MVTTKLLPTTAIIVGGAALAYVQYRYGVIPFSRLLQSLHEEDDIWDFKQFIEVIEDHTADIVAIEPSNDAIHITDTSELAPPFTGIWSHFSYEQMPAQLGSPGANAPTIAPAVLATDLCLQPEESTGSANSSYTNVKIVVILGLSAAALLLLWRCGALEASLRRCVHKPSKTKEAPTTGHVEEANQADDEADEADEADTEADEADKVDTEADEADTESDTEADEADEADTEADEADKADTEADEADKADTEVYQPNEAREEVHQADEAREEVYQPKEAREEVHQANEAREEVYQANEAREEVYQPNEAREEVYQPNEAREEVHQADEAREEIYQPKEAREEVYQANEAREEVYQANEAREEVYQPNEAREEVHQANEAREEVYQPNETHEEVYQADAEADSEDVNEVHDANDDTGPVEEAHEVEQDEEQHGITDSNANSYLASNEFADYRCRGGAPSNNGPPTDLLDDVIHGETNKTSAESASKLRATENSVKAEVDAVSAFRDKWIEVMMIEPPHAVDTAEMADYVQQVSKAGEDVMASSYVVLCSLQTRMLDDFRHHARNSDFLSALRKHCSSLASVQDNPGDIVSALFSVTDTNEQVGEKQFDNALCAMPIELAKKWDIVRKNLQGLDQDIQTVVARSAARSFFDSKSERLQTCERLLSRVHGIMHWFNEPVNFIDAQCIALQTCALAASESGCTDSTNLPTK